MINKNLKENFFKYRVEHYLLILEAIRYDLRKPVKKHKKEIARNISIAGAKMLPLFSSLRDLEELPKKYKNTL